MTNFFDLQNRIDKEGKRDRVIELCEPVYTIACRKKPDLVQLKNKLKQLIEFLCSPEGRTHENCCTVDSYFSSKDDWPDCFKHLPRDLYEILFDIGGMLHDAIQNPEIAANFYSLPEQLRERIIKINI